MAVTTFYLASAGESITILSTSTGFNFVLNRNSGDQIPADAIIDSVSLVLSATYQYSSMRLFVTAKDGANMHDPRSTSGNSASSNVLESLNISLYNTNFYAGLDSLQITIMGAGKGSASSDGNVFNMRSNCEFTLTVNWHVRTACGTPANVGLSKTLADPGEAVTLSWNSAVAGADNPITGYEVWRSVNGGAYTLLQTISTGATSSSLAVTANATHGANNKYKIITKGTYAGLNSGYSTEVTLTTRTPTVAGAPTLVSLAKTTADPSENVLLSWSGASGGTLNGINGYIIQRRDGAGAWADWQTVTTTASSGSYTVAAHSAWGSNYSYRVITKGAAGSGYYSTASSAVTLTTRTPTAAGTPTSASVPALSENDPSLSFSGATGGTLNGITGYEIQYAESSNGSTWGAWTALKSITTTSTSGSTSVTLPSIRGYYRKYRIRTLGAAGSGYYSGWKETGAVRKNSAPTAPTSVSIVPLIFESGYIEISWIGATDADNNIVRYDIQFATAADGITYGDWINSTDTPAASPISDTAGSLLRGQARKYRMRAVDIFGVASDWCESNVFKRNQVPGAPNIIYPTLGKTIYNSRPRMLVTIGSDADNQLQTLSASGYTPSSTGAQAAGKKLIFRRTSAALAGEVLFTVTSSDTLGVSSLAATCSTMYTAPAWTDGMLLGGTNRIKATHLNELRTAINQVRAYYGLSAFAWAESVTAGQTSMAGWAGHVAEIRTAIEEAAMLVNAWDSTGTEHKIILPAWIAITGKRPIAAVMEQLRAVIALL